MGEHDDGEDPRAWGAATRAVRGGLNRSNFGEVAEALYLTQSFVYDTARAPTRASPATTRASSTPATATPRPRCSRTGWR